MILGPISWFPFRRSAELRSRRGAWDGSHISNGKIKSSGHNHDRHRLRQSCEGIYSGASIPLLNLDCTNARCSLSLSRLQ
jgi:hypothetical protein